MLKLADAPVLGFIYNDRNQKKKAGKGYGYGYGYGENFSNGGFFKKLFKRK